MDSSSKLKLTTEDGEDRISALPDRVLSHILSLLPTKYAVLTSILRTRWLHLWTCIDNLDFDNHLFLNERNFDKDYDKIFESFVKQVIARCNSETIRSFRLACRGQRICMSSLHDWICTIANRNVEKLEINVSMARALQLPDNFFTCTSLVSLKLHLETAFSLPALSNYFPNLKLLHISLMYASPQLAEKLFTICPLLENLSINFGPGDETEMTFNISASRLKKLRVDVWNEEDYTEYEFVIDAPLLEYINFKDKQISCCIKTPLLHLWKAVLDFGDDDYLRMGYDYEKQQLLHAHNLLGAVASTTYLSLSSQAMMAIHHAQHDGELPYFPNLTTLKIEMYDFMGAKMLPKFLEESPNLEVLILTTEQHDDDECKYRRPFRWMSWNLMPHLRVCKILSFWGRPVEWHLVEYFLGNANSLQKMVVRAGERKRSRREKLSDKLSELPRASEACVVKVV